jgi:mRNA-degrading endonuclease toxin of MazEF toxin-antitoxin module
VNLDHVQTVARAKLGGPIASLTAAKMAEVRAALLFAVGMERGS